MCNSSDKRLLLVQADPVLAELTSLHLELMGYRVDVAGTGAEATNFLHQPLPNLAIVDTQLPDMDCVDWITRLRSHYTLEQIPVILFSLECSELTIERAYLAGVQDHVEGNVDPSELEKKIERLLFNQSLLRRRWAPLR